jgi:predicted pyridoxine 5'-phosphate oxidase superfamily flavin-nucleotide-binding protein
MRPGSEGEHALQERYATLKRAAAFYDKQMLDHLNPLMREYIAQQDMAFIATADAHGECDTSFRAGPAGFMRVLDERTLMYPEYRGNGVMASLGNISENGHVGILFVDFFKSTVGLHVNGRARVVEPEAVLAFGPILERMAGVTDLHEEVADKKKTPERWVLVEVVEAYIHCSKHIPLLRKLDKDIDWGTDNEVRKGGDYFKAKHDARPWVQPAEPGVAPAEPSPVAEPAVLLTCELPVEASQEAVAAESTPAPVAEDTHVPEPTREETLVPAPVAEDTHVPEPIREETLVPAPVAEETHSPEPVADEAAYPADDAARAVDQEHSVDGDDLLDLWVLTAPADAAYPLI